MNTIEKLEALFVKFPGIGPRQAARFVYFLLRQHKGFRRELAEHLLQLDAAAVQCPGCMRFSIGSTEGFCAICSSATRSNEQLVVVEKDVDIDALERAGTYSGRYFVLGGVRTAAGAAVPAFEVAFFARVKKGMQTGGLKEIILALSATPDGEYTADDIKHRLEELYGDALTVTALGRGLSTGSELEYADARTIESALKNRG